MWTFQQNPFDGESRYPSNDLFIRVNHLVWPLVCTSFLDSPPPIFSWIFPHIFIFGFHFGPPRISHGIALKHEDWRALTKDINQRDISLCSLTSSVCLQLVCFITQNKLDLLSTPYRDIKVQELNLRTQAPVPFLYSNYRLFVLVRNYF